MNAILIRCGVDQEWGAWNAPVDAENRFVYVPIPESEAATFQPGLERHYGELLPALHRLCDGSGCDLHRDLQFPQTLMQHAMHLDPDFECLTYGNPGNTKGLALASLKDGDLVVFYAGLRPLHECEHRLIYALVGLFVVDEVVPARSVPPDRWYQNAHTRRALPGETDLVVRAKRGRSGRFDRCIPIGEWRNRAYRVRQEVLDAWGGLSVNDGWIHRNAVPPSLTNPSQFLAWLNSQSVQLLERNN